MGMSVERAVRTGQLMTGALITGILTMTGVAVLAVEVWKLDVDASLSKLLLLVWGAMAVSEIVAYFVLRSVLQRRLREHADLDMQSPQLVNTLVTLFILGVAMPEGLALFAAVIYLLTGERAVLVLVGVGILLVAIQLPSLSKWREAAGQLRR